MNAFSRWKPAATKYGFALGLTTVLSAVAIPALGCSLYSATTPTAERAAPAQEGAALTPAVYRADSGGFLPVASEEGATNGGIVGLWRISMISDGIAPNPVPQGAVVDFGTVQWHDDGTEIMISGGRPPSSGDVCMGVWEKTGPFTYKLKHLALAWISSDTPPSMGGPGPSPAKFVGPAIIREVVTLDKSRAMYRGTFTLDQYNADESALLLHVSGSIAGARVTVD